MNIYIGLDGGGTKTELIVMNEHWEQQGFYVSGASNPRSIGFEPAVKVILGLLLQAMTDHYTGGPVHWSIGLGIAGVDTPEERAAIAAAVKTALQANQLYAAIRVMNDAEIALAAALDSEFGVLAIAGTGSIVFGRTPAGAYYRVGGWGHLLGDEGSGYRIGLDVLQTVMRCYDGVLKATAMTGLILDAWGFSSITELKGFIYRPEVQKQDIAGFARYAMEAGRQGDELAKQLIERHAHELAGHACALLGKDAWFTQADLVLSGSIFAHSPLYQSAFRKRVGEAYPDVRMHEARRSPAYGAARLAARRTT